MSLFTREEREETTRRVSRLLGDEELPAVTSEWVGKLYELLPVVHHFETAFGDTLVRGFLLENLLELDIAFDQAERFSIWGPARVIFDRSGRITDAANAPDQGDIHASDRAGEAGFAWHDVLHACTAVRRGRPWQGLWYMERVRNRTLKLAQERRGFYADFFDYVDDLPEEELTPLENTFAVSLAPESLLGAIEVATRAFLAELRHGEPALANRLEVPLLEFVRLRESETI
jgi:hypothetical protein